MDRLIPSLVSYITGEKTKLQPNTIKAMQKREWLAEDGKTVTQSGILVSGVPTVDITFLVLGVDVVLGKHTLPKDLKLPITWADRSHKDRRNWYYTVALPFKDGEEAIHLPLYYNPKHTIEIRKLPLDKRDDLGVQ